MSWLKKTPQRKHRRKVVPVLRAAGLSFVAGERSLAGAGGIERTSPPAAGQRANNTARGGDLRG